MENNLNKLLTRQIKRHFGSTDNLPDELKVFVKDINETYNNFDDDTRIIQNSIEISSQELREAYQKHKLDAEHQRETIANIKEAIAALNSTNHNLDSESEADNADSSDLFGSLIKLIEERKQAESELIKLKAAVEQSSSTVVITDINGNIQYVNQKFNETTGYTVQEALGQNPRIFKSNELSTEKYKELWDTILSGKNWYGEFHNKRKNGSYYWEYASISPIRDAAGKIISFLGVKEDISIRKQIEEALQTKTSILEAQTNATIDAILIIDVNQKRVLINQRAIELFDVPPYILDDDDDTLLLKHVVGLTKYPDKFIEKVMYLYDHPNEKSSDEIEFKRGTILDMYSAPVLGKNGENFGRIWTFRDITERKQMEEKLKSSEENFRTFFDSIADLLFVLDSNGNMIDVNETVLRRLEYSKEELMGQSVLVVHPEARREEAGIIVAAMLDGTKDFCPIPVISKSGIEIQVETRIYPGVWDGEPALFGVVKDITKMKQSEEKFSKAFQAGSNLMAISTIKSGLYIDVNNMFLQVLGFTREEVIGKTSQELNIFEDKLQREIIKTGIKENGFVKDIELNIKTKTGNKLIGLFSASYIHIGDEPCWLTTMTDITERKMAEQDLAELSTRLSLATRAGGVGVWDYDLINNTLIWDDQMFKLYGITKETFDGAYETWKAGLHPDDAEKGELEVQMAISGKKEFNTEFRIIWPDGSIHTIRSFAEVQLDNAGKPFRMVGTNWDNTVKKMDEEKLIKALTAAEAANKAKSEFLANMSHEIRTPLNGVIGFTDLLQSTPLSPVQQQYVKNANASGYNLLGIINDILDFSKIEAGMMDLEIINTDLIKLLGQSVDIVKYAADKKKLEVLLNIDPKMPRFASVDPIRLKQIFANLMGNAVKFTEKGEIELKVKYDDLGNNKGRFYFSVRDTGIGINTEQQKKLFKVFSQADSSITRKYGGTGLGLVISQMIAKKMDSDISITSKQSVGTTFHFEIETDTARGKKADAGSMQLIKRCFVIDDNENNRIILEHTMANWGIECMSSDNGLTALGMLESSGPFDVIICDYHMPYIDGLETIKLIREKLKLTADIQPIILLHSSSDDAELHKRCDELNVRFKLTKPVKMEELYSYLTNIQAPVNTKAAVQAIMSESISESITTILIAEDVEMNMLLVKYMLGKAYPDAVILEAVDGKEAIAMWQNEKPDLILMDMQMPIMDGVEATISIREMEKSAGTRIPIIALTAGAMVEEKEKCLAAGMDDFVTKPIDHAKLIVVIDKALKKQI